MQGCAVHRGIKNVGREPSWCRLNSEYHKVLLYSHLREQVNDVRMVVSPCGADRETSMASSWMENPTYQDEILPNH